MLAGGRPSPRARRAEARGLPPASPPAGRSSPGHHLAQRHRLLPLRFGLPHTEGTAAPPASPRPGRAEEVRGITRAKPGLSRPRAACLAAAGTQCPCAPSPPASRRGAGVRDPVRQARTCRLHNHRRPHAYPALHKGPCPRQPPPADTPAAAPPAGGQREGPGGGGGPGRAPR